MVKDQPEMWEYTFFNLGSIPSMQGMRDLNDLGKDGWELVCAYAFWGILKRPAQEELPANPNEEASGRIYP